jgi:hypothetical protein
MRQTVDFYTFEREFRDYNRFDQFGYDALRALFDYFEELEESTGTELDLYVIAICCDWTAYSDAMEAWSEYNAGQPEGADIDEQEAIAMEWLHEQTTVIAFSGGILVHAF